MNHSPNVENKVPFSESLMDEATLKRLACEIKYRKAEIEHCQDAILLNRIGIKDLRRKQTYLQKLLDAYDPELE